MKTTDTIYVDGMESGSFDSATLRAIRSGQVDCITVTCGFWDDAVESLDAIARWRDLIEAKGLAGGGVLMRYRPENVK